MCDPGGQVPPSVLPALAALLVQDPAVDIPISFTYGFEPYFPLGLYSCFGGTLANKEDLGINGGNDGGGEVTFCISFNAIDRNPLRTRGRTVRGGADGLWFPNSFFTTPRRATIPTFAAVFTALSNECELCLSSFVVR